MNINEYIASGIIEQYVHGSVSSQEKQEVECMSHIYPEIKQELLQVQQALEGFAMENAVEVPKHVKQNIFKQIAEEAAQQKPIQTTKVVSLNTTTTKNNYKKYLAAASVIFIAALATMYISLNKRNSNNELAANNKINALEKTVATTQQQLQEQSLFNNNYYVLPGTPKAPNKSLAVAWNKQTGKVFINNVSLPQTPANKQYQLWGLKDGKPIDLGVFDVNNTVQTMKNVTGIQAFAVTLEDKGGKPTPNLSELYAIVNI